jgi:hypothetical protein
MTDQPSDEPHLDQPEESLPDAEQSGNPYASPQVSDEFKESDEDPLARESSRRGKIHALLGMIAAFAANGFVIGMLPEEGPIDQVVNLGTAIVFGLLVVHWYDWDRWEKRIPPWRYFTPLVVLFPGPLVMVPIYLLRTRGVKGLWPVVQAATFLTLLMAVGTAAVYAGSYFMSPAS